MSRIVVIGIGADGMGGLAERSRTELRSATVVYGSDRQLGLLDGTVAADRRSWPSPLLEALPALLDQPHDVHVLASGDPLLHGIGVTVIRLFGPQRVTVLPHVSSPALACARLGWSVADTEVISLVSAPPHTAVRRGGRAIVLSRGRSSPPQLAALLCEHGRADSQLSVFEQLGGPAERRRDGTAREWAGAAESDLDDLNVIAVRYLPDEAGVHLPDSAFETTGQLTKYGIRAVTLAALAPRPGERLWDVGSGSGSIAVSWARSAPGCTAVAFEHDEARRRDIARNAAGAGARVEVRGAAPEAFGGAAAPAAVFIGGGLTTPGLLEGCLQALPAGGRLVANTVTVESEAVLLQAYSQHGGVLRRLEHHRVEPLGAFRGWLPHRPVTQWELTR
ncbi:precorrin-6y C5,15-methyltransferase (decarboxylating) subunit CbiE [Mycobacterium sp. 1274756.6]|uniref:precorrin-6y C5,15-methyltransferase (decarboxylating) subunit CbiE n=1 Tax=Mycobacterium sp. 1274756.6 TaxID=1834076 RepID=UPI0009EE670E|nr:precorrin-6y C5,15-methyltransferase (decarboxylating) subunit CbiE [Mycobacterium sp. 1274756.6]